MINFFLKYHIKTAISFPASFEDIQDAKKILFSIFTRYGDTIIDLAVIKEFIEYHPKKEYLILCPRQMKPYVSELLPNIECITINKRNIFEMLKVHRILKERMYDVGFNPWSNGLDSCYFTSYCKKFLFYKDFKRPDIINHYQVIRRYLELPAKDWLISPLKLKKNYQNILICPQSTDNNRSIASKSLDNLIIKFQEIYKQPDITIASMDKIYFRKSCKNFYFKKTAFSSQQFINLIKRNALVVCSDSGPLHIALALKKDLVAFMPATSPNIVINTGSCLKINQNLAEN